MYAKNKNVTYIEELPELEDLEPGRVPRGSIQQPGQQIPEKFKKFIRHSMGPPAPESGMAPYQPQPSKQQEFFTPPPQHQAPIRPPAGSPSCLDIADHVGACPICSKFYKNDNSIYIIAIVVLAIICILLLKKVLNL